MHGVDILQSIGFQGVIRSVQLNLPDDVFNPQLCVLFGFCHHNIQSTLNLVATIATLDFFCSSV